MASEKDDRLFIQLALDFASHPKIKPLSDKAFRILIEMLLWSADLGTDGFIQAPMFKTFGTAKARAELLSNDPKRPSVVKVEGGYRLHDYEKHNRLRREIEELRRKRAEAGARGGKAKANAKQVLQQTGEQKGSNFYPDVRSQIDQDLNTSSPEPERASDRTDEAESVEALCARQAQALGVDFAKVKTAIGKACGRFPDPTGVIQIIATVLERATPPIKSPTGLVIRAVENDWPEWQKLLDESEVA